MQEWGAKNIDRDFKNIERTKCKKKHRETVTGRTKWASRQNQEM